MRLSRFKPSPAMIIALVALFVALGGVSYAAAKIGTAQLKNGAVTTPKLHTNAVTSPKLKNGAVTAGKLGTNAVTKTKIAPGAVTSDALADSSVSTENLSVGVVTSEKLTDGAVLTAKLGDGAVESGKLGDLSVTTEKLASGAVKSTKLGATNVHSNSDDIPSMSSGAVAVACGSGEALLSGGGYFNGSTVGDKAVVATYPVGNSWVVVGTNNTATTQTLNVNVLCLEA
jgi:hypothetical protein